MTTAPDGASNFSTVELDRRQCLELLHGARIGRVVLSVDCIPVALPVNLSMLDEDVIFCTDSGSKLTAAVEGQVVSVEIDEIDPFYRMGWSVLATGVAQLITDPDGVERARGCLAPWAPGPHPFLVKVPSTLISGRRLMWVGLENAGSQT